MVLFERSGERILYIKKYLPYLHGLFFYQKSAREFSYTQAPRSDLRHCIEYLSFP